MQPRPLAPTHNASAGSSSKAQARDRSGRLSSNAANAAVAIVATEPSTASHMSGIAVMRRHIAVTSANIAIATATAATSMSQISVRSAGGGSGRTGRRSATSAPIRRSLESSISISAIHLEAQRAQRPMQAHLERSFAAPRQYRGVGQRSLVNHEMLDSLALARRQFG